MYIERERVCERDIEWKTYTILYINIEPASERKRVKSSPPTLPRCWRKKNCGKGVKMVWPCGDGYKCWQKIQYYNILWWWLARECWRKEKKFRKRLGFDKLVRKKIGNTGPSRLPVIEQRAACVSLVFCAVSSKSRSIRSWKTEREPFYFPLLYILFAGSLVYLWQKKVYI